MFTKEMQKALEADGEKLRQQTGEDHGPTWLCEICGHPMDKPPMMYCPGCDPYRNSGTD